MSVLGPKSSVYSCYLKGQHLEDMLSLSNGLGKDDFWFTQTLYIENRFVF